MATVDTRPVREDMFLLIAVRVAARNENGEGSVLNPIGHDEFKKAGLAKNAWAILPARRTPAASLFSRLVILRAMNRGIAPLPVSGRLEKALARRGFQGSVDELGIFVHRYHFLQDPRILLAEVATLLRLNANSPDLDDPSKSSFASAHKNHFVEV